MNYTKEISKARQVFDFCFADEEKLHPFQIQLNYNKSAWSQNSSEDIEDFFKADLYKLYLNESPVYLTDTIGFTSFNKVGFDDAGFNNYVSYLDYQYQKATNREALLLCIDEFILEAQRSRAQSRGGSIEFIPGKELLPDSFEVEVKAWLQKKRRNSRILNNNIVNDLPMVRESLILSRGQILNVYDYFNGVLFDEMTFAAFCDCFNLESQTTSPPRYKDEQQIKFVYFLSHIKAGTRDIVNNKIAERNFGIKNYK